MFEYEMKGEKMTFDHMECMEEILRRTQFVTLDFEYSFLEDETLTSLCDMIEFYDSCNRLNLSFNQHIGIRGWQALFRTVRKTPCLEQLNLRYTSLNERCVPILARTLRQGCAIKVLHLENCSLTGKPLLLLACALKCNDSVSELYLGENSLNPNDANHIQQLISGSKSITLIDVRNNHLQFENKTVQTLNLGANNLHSDGIVKLKEALARNRTILRLGFQATKLNCQGAIAIAECIADNPMLIRVDLRDNPDIKSAGLLALHLAIKINTSITTLNLDKTCCSSSTLKVLKVRDYGDQFRQLYNELEEFCERNRKIYMQHLRDNNAEQGLIPCSLVGDKDVLPVEEDRAGSSVVMSSPNEIKSMPRPKLLHTQQSLTCHDNVEDVEQRMKSMPPVDIDLISAKDSESDTDSPQSSSEIKSTELKSIPQIKQAEIAPIPQPPIIQKPIICIGATKSQTKRKKKRFQVSSVTTDDIITKAPDRSSTERNRSISLNEHCHVDDLKQKIAPKKEGNTLRFDEAEISEAVKSVVNDLVTFCVYEIGEYAHTPSVARSRNEIFGDFEKRNLLPDLPHIPDCKPDLETDIEREMAVTKTVRDLVKMTIVGERDSIRLALRHRRKKINKDTFEQP